MGAAENKHKMRKHFDVVVADGKLAFSRKSESIEAEAALDGIYVIRTGEPPERLTAEDAVRGYKSLAEVERLYRTMKGVDILVRPIHHREPERVKAHIFICMLAYYVEWHLREAMKELLFDDEERRERNAGRKPETQAEPSESAKRKKGAKKTKGGLLLHSFDTLLMHLATRARVTLGLAGAPSVPPWTQLTEPTAVQARALALLEAFPVNGK